MGLAQLSSVFSSKETQRRQRKGQEQTVDTHNKLLLDSRKPNYQELKCVEWR